MKDYVNVKPSKTAKPNKLIIVIEGIAFASLVGIVLFLALILGA